MRTTLSVACVPVRDLNLHRASDPEIFRAARDAQVVVMTKDADFVGLLDQYGAWPTILPMLERGEVLVELGDQPSHAS